MRALLLLLVVGLLMPADDPLDPSGVLDYLGRPQPLGRKSLSLAQASGGGQVTAPVTPSVGQRASAAREAATGLLPAGGLDPIGLSRAGLQFAEEALRLFPPEASTPAFAQPSRAFAEEVAAGRTPQTDIFNPDFIGAPPQQVGSSGVQGGPGLTPAEAATAAEAEGGSAASSAAPSVVGTTGQVLPYLAGALTTAQDLTAPTDDRTKIMNTIIDAAALALIPTSAGLSEVAAPLAKLDTARVFNDPLGMPYKGAIPGLLPVADLVQLFGGPDLIGELFGDTPSRFEAVRKAAEKGGAQAEGALGGVYAQATDPASLYSALGSRAADRGSVRSYLNLPSDAATQLGLPEGGVQWAQLSPKQFMDVLRYFRDDPSRLQYVGGSGDVGYLGQGEAEALGGQTASAARTAISRIIAGGLPEASAPVTMPEAPSAASGPEGSLGFARSLIESE